MLRLATLFGALTLLLTLSDLAHAADFAEAARRALLGGQYAKAIRLAADVGKQGVAQRVAVAPVRAEALIRGGRRAAAIRLLENVSGEPAAHHARLLLGETLIGLGKRREGEVHLMKIIEAYNADAITDRDAHGLAIVGRAAYLLRAYRDANDAFDMAERAGADKDVQALLWRAELFLDKYDPGNAAKVVALASKLAPRDPRVQVKRAEVKLVSTMNFAAAEKDVADALAIDDKRAEAFFVRVGLALRTMSLDRAEAAAKQGLRVDPGNLKLLSGLAATRFLAEDEPGFSAIEKRVLEINPSYSRFYTIVAEFAEWEHRYDDIVKLTRKAVAVDSRDAKAYAALGLNLIRKGEEPAGLEELRKAWRRDKYNVRVFNTLELYDGPIARDYVTVDGARFRIRYHKGDKPILERYLPQLLDQAWTAMVKRYGFSPKVPVGIEIYADRQHFSVRTSGLPNIGIQGVCFGKTLAALGPSVGRLNWGMIVWHELAHVFHIQLSKSRVPRWFTEGLAEYESLLARPEWQREEEPALYDAFRRGRVPKVAMFNRAFTHVERPREVTMAYFAASPIAVHLAETRGKDVFAPMLRAWGAGKTTPEVMKDVLSVGPDAVDRAFLTWLKPRMAIYAKQFVPSAEPADSLDKARDGLAASPNDPERMLTLALTLARERKITEARATLQIALASAKKHAGLNFAALQLAMGDKDEAKAKKYLAALLDAGHDGYAVRLRAADLAEVAGDKTSMRAHLVRASKFDPSQAEPLQALYDLARDRKDSAQQLSTLRALAKLDQHDRRVWRRLLRLLVARGYWAEAVKVGESAMYADVGHAETHYLYARALARSGRHVSAIYELNSAIFAGASPKIAKRVYHTMAEGYRKLGQAEHAKLAGRYGESIVVDK